MVLQKSPWTGRQQTEIFHFLFLERLLKISNPGLYILKGGVNLRFYFNSPRYSEDMDLDVLAGSVSTLKKNCYKILSDPSFNRSLQTYGIMEIRLNDPTKAKQTETTQRFRVRLMNVAGEEFPTKIEFSRRKKELIGFERAPIDPKIANPYHRLSFTCQHYTATAAIFQKIAALLHRKESQARDLFDLYILWLGGSFDPQIFKKISQSEREQVKDRVLSFVYNDFKGQVLEYLEAEQQLNFGSQSLWNEIQQTVAKVFVGK